MKTLIQLFQQHPYYGTVILTWFGSSGINAFVTALPAPTKDSTQFYIFCFKFCNLVLAGNLRRYQSTAVENSPNWKDAIDKHLAEQPPSVDRVLPPNPPKP